MIVIRGIVVLCKCVLCRSDESIRSMSSSVGVDDDAKHAGASAHGSALARFVQAVPELVGSLGKYEIHLRTGLSNLT